MRALSGALATEGRWEEGLDRIRKSGQYARDKYGSDDPAAQRLGPVQTRSTTDTPTIAGPTIGCEKQYSNIDRHDCRLNWAADGG